MAITRRTMLTRSAIGLPVVGLVARLAAQQQKRVELDVPYVPSTDDAVRTMLKLADVKKSDVVYDLGCGDGRIVVTAAKAFGARGVGIDIDPERIAEARENAKKANVENLVRFDEKSFFDADIREATVVTMFLLSSVNERLRPKLLAELKPGTRIVSNTFEMSGWTPEKQVEVEGADETAFLSKTIFLWRVPEKKK